MVARSQVGILIVDPSETYQRIMEAQLRKLGFSNIFRTGNGPKARVMLQHNKTISVVISELMMPDIEDCLGMVRDIRERYKPDELPILILTTHSEKDYVQQAVDAGVNGYMIKPVDPAHLEAHLLRLFDLPLRGSRRLGEFLVRSQMITPDQRDVALQFQKEYSAEFLSAAQLALYLGYVNERQLMATVFKHQLDDDGFFQWAESLGLTEAQVAHLKETKKRYRLRIGDILVKFGYLPEEKLQEALAALDKQKNK